jgi:hypothetical protein
MPTHTQKRTWSAAGGALPITYQTSQAGNVESNLDLVVNAGVTLPSSIAITRSTLQSFYLASSQPVTCYVGGLNSVQTLTPGGSIDPTDMFFLTWGGHNSATMLFSVNGAAVQAALEATTGVGAGNVSVTGPSGGPWRVEFVGALALGARSAITDTISTVASATIAVTQTQVGTSPTQTIAVAAGVPIAWTKDDAASNPLAGDVAKLSVYNAGTSTATVALRSLFN